MPILENSEGKKTVRSAVGQRKQRESLFLVADHRPPAGSQPDAPVVVGQHVPDPLSGLEGVVPAAVPRSKGLEALAIITTHAGAQQRKPETTGPILGHGEHIVAAQAVLGGEPPEGFAVIADGAPTLSGKPHVACIVLDDAFDAKVGYACHIGGGEMAELLAVVAADTPVGAKPQVTLAILGNGLHLRAGQTVSGGEVGKLAAIPAADAAAVTACPQGPLAIDQQAYQLVVADPVPRVKAGKRLAVPAADAPTAGGKPQMPVQIFGGGADDVVGQAVGRGEGGEGVAVPATESA